MKLKKILLLIFGIFLFFILISCNKKDDNNENTNDEDIKYEEIESSYKLLNFDSTISEKNYKYSDAYFLNESFNKDLMKTSYAIQYFSIDIETNKNSNRIYKEQLNKLGYSDFYCNDYFYEDTKIDDVGMMFSSKDVKLKNKDYKIINLSLRGNAYYYEWAGNFVIGENGDHKGFKSAAIKTIEELNKYAKSIDAKDVILWITGYSRAAAIANLATAYIDNYLNYKEKNVWLTDEYKIDNLSFDLKLNDIYCYCFESPSGALIENQNKLTSVTYNIYNIINEYDIVGMVLPIGLGFTKYGFVKSYDFSNDIDLKNKINEEYKDGYKTNVDEYVFCFNKKSDDDKLLISFSSFDIYLHKLDTKVNVKNYFEEQVNLLVKVFKTRSNYNKIIDDLIEEIFDKFLSLSVEDRKSFIEDLKNNFFDFGISSLLFKSKINDILKITCEKYNIVLSENVYNSLSKIHSLLFDIISNEIIPDNDGFFSKRIATIVANFMDMGVNHFPEFIETFVNII